MTEDDYSTDDFYQATKLVARGDKSSFNEKCYLMAALLSSMSVCQIEAVCRIYAPQLYFWERDNKAYKKSLKAVRAAYKKHLQGKEITGDRLEDFIVDLHDGSVLRLMRLGCVFVSEAICNQGSFNDGDIPGLICHEVALAVRQAIREMVDEE